MRREKKEKERLNLVLDKSLKQFAREYAAKHGMSITHLIESYLRELRARQSRQL